MLFDEAGEVFEFFRGALPYYMIVVLPILIIVSPVNPVNGAHDFAVYRMQHYDLQGNPRGSRNSVVNLEARTLDSSFVTRRCILAKLNELSPAKYRDLLSQGAGALLVLVPANLSSLHDEERSHIVELEVAMVAEETPIPVYFAVETSALLEIYDNIKYSLNSEQAISATEALLGSLTTSGYQLVVNAAQTKAITEPQVANIQGKLSGYGVEEQLQSITIVAHYDSFGVAPALSYGADSNGSGVAALLELARLFSKLYTNSRTHARFNLLFLLSGAGKFNYQGTKKWIEDNLDNTDGSLLQESAYSLCLDTIGNGDHLYLHVSKPPKEGSPGALLLQEMRSVSNHFFPELKFDQVHKKINLAEDTLAWEHERFSIRRLPAFTLSHLSSSKELHRNSILDSRDHVDVGRLARNVKIIAEALARHIYNLSSHSEVEVFSDSMSVQEDYLAAWLDHLTAEPRGAQLLASSNKAPLIASIEQTLSRFLKEVKISYVKPDKRDPEFSFFDVTSTTMTAYSVKPAVFDLILMGAIALYLCILYFIIQAFPQVYGIFKQQGIPLKSKQG